MIIIFIIMGTLFIVAMQAGK
jgi:hypothetical protein